MQNILTVWLMFRREATEEEEEAEIAALLAAGIVMTRPCSSGTGAARCSGAEVIFTTPCIFH